MLSALALFAQIHGVAAVQLGDDFSNNIFSDLAPILTLFGEQVAKQFMAGSMFWEDNVIFAMVSGKCIHVWTSLTFFRRPHWVLSLLWLVRLESVDPLGFVLSSEGLERTRRVLRWS